MPGDAVRIYGTEKLALLGKDLAIIGGPGARGIRAHTRKAIIASARPIQRDVQAAYRATSVSGVDGSTGLRESLARATQIKILISSRNALVRIWVNPARMPGGEASLPAMWEGLKTWRHPVYGHRQVWVTQSSRPTFDRAARAHLGAVRAEVVAAVVATVRQLPKEL